MRTLFVFIAFMGIRYLNQLIPEAFTTLDDTTVMGFITVLAMIVLVFCIIQDIGAIKVMWRDK